MPLAEETVKCFFCFGRSAIFFFVRTVTAGINIWQGQARRSYIRKIGRRVADKNDGRIEDLVDAVDAAS